MFTGGRKTWYKLMRRDKREKESDYWTYAGVICTTLEAAKKQASYLVSRDGDRYQIGIFEVERKEK